MPKKIKFVVGEGESGSRLDVCLSLNYPDISRSLWQKTVNTGDVLVNGRTVRVAKQICKSGDEIVAVKPSQPKLSLKSDTKQLEIIYEDDDVVVINKPAGLVVHPVRVGEASVAGSLSDKIIPDGSLRPGIVHRLDRDTSGVMILAKNNQTKDYLMKLFKNRQVKKTYLALVWNRPKHDQATIDIALERDRMRGDRRKISNVGKASQTKYKVIRYFKNSSLLEVHPLTGRTHQIRVHLAHIGCPIVSDRMYGPKKTNGILTRQFLHASSLSLNLPGGQRKVFEAELPPDLEKYLGELT